MLITPSVSSASVIACRLTVASSPTISNNTNTQITFDTTVRSDGGLTIGGGHAVTISAGAGAGWYDIHIQTSFPGSSAGTTRQISAWVNGAYLCAYSVGFGAADVYLSGDSGAVYLNIGDTVDMYIFQDSGGSMTLINTAMGRPTLSMVKH